MRKIISIFVIQLLNHISRVLSLFGHQNFSPISYGEFPFIASFQYFPGGHNFCGGALIAKKHVITLSPCVKNLSPGRFRIAFEVANAQGPALTYTAASWTTYIQWARRRGAPYGKPDKLGVAIVTLSDTVYNVNPVPLNALTKSQLDGKEATMIGWRNDVLSRATVKVLNENVCERRIQMLRNNSTLLDDRALCNSADPYALLDVVDMGSPLLHAHDKSLLAIACSYSPADQNVRGNFSNEFIRQHQVNVHVSVRYYRLFIHSVIPEAPAA